MQICIYLLGEKQIGGLFTNYVSLLPLTPSPILPPLHICMQSYSCSIATSTLLSLSTLTLLVHFFYFMKHLGRMLGWECNYVCLLLSFYVNHTL